MTSTDLDGARRAAVARYAHLADAETVSACFDAIVAHYRTATVTSFVPLLAERELRKVFAEA